MIYKAFQKVLKQVAIPAVLLAASPAIAMPGFVNPGFDGTPGANNVPPGWTGVQGTPDTQDINHSGGFPVEFNPWVVPPITSSGEFAGLYSPGAISADPNESIGQLVSGFDVGSTYSVFWDEGNFGHRRLGATRNEGWIGVSVDSVAIGTGGLLAIGEKWFHESLTFVASATSHFIEFTAIAFLKGDRGGPFYASLEDVGLTCISRAEDCVPVPLPSTLFLSALALFGLRIGRRVA